MQAVVDKPGPPSGLAGSRGGSGSAVGPQLVISVQGGVELDNGKDPAVAGELAPPFRNLGSVRAIAATIFTRLGSEDDSACLTRAD